MRAVYLALKDLLQILRDWKAAFFLVIMPIAFTLLFGFASGGFGSVEESDPRLPVGYVDQDQGFLGQHLLSLLATSDVIRPKTGLTSVAEAEELVSGGNWAAAIMVPAGFANHMLAGDILPLTVIVEDDNSTAPAIRGEVQAAATDHPNHSSRDPLWTLFGDVCHDLYPIVDIDHLCPVVLASGLL